MSESCLRRAAVALASAAILAVASTIAPSFAQSSRDADAPRLYRIEVIAFSYNEGDPMEELFAHTAARASIEAVDREAGAETFDFSRYLPPSVDEPFGSGDDEELGAQERRPRTLLGADETPIGSDEASVSADQRSAGQAAEPDAAAPAERDTSDGAAPGTVASDDPGAAGRDPLGVTGPDAPAAGAGEPEPADPFGPGPVNAAAEFRFRLLAPEELKLFDTYQRLERLDAYTPLVHGGWVQEGLPLGSAKPFDLAYLGASNPAGTIRLHLSRYLHLAVDLVYRADTGRDRALQPGLSGFEGSAPSMGGRTLSDVSLPARYVLRAQRRIGSGIVQYFDHPMFGVLVLVEPYEPPARTASDSGPAA